ncbi:MAG TPA: GDSL-type esterase/lipase family protein [Terriglobales bacterium]|nr:GDSL-type esterase/lipase family protein [Terriglobales bacterium]
MQATPPNRLKSVLFGCISFIVTLVLCLAAAEGILRMKNASMKNYDVEMWRYAKELKFASPIPVLGHEHLPDASAVLQSVDIRTNAWGLRGGPVSEKPAPNTRRILLLGGSIALGWGVPEDQVLSTLLQKKLEASGQKVEVLNAGIGNYNAERYIERFLQRLTPLEPTDLLVLAFVRDGEPLEQGSNNFLLRHSELVMTAWIVANRIFGATGEQNLIDHSRNLYRLDSPAVARMKAEFGKLANYAKQHRIKVVMAMVPDTHQLDNYPLGFVHDVFASVARDNGFAYIDLLKQFQGLSPEQIWAMPGDPHPNARGHALMADAIATMYQTGAPTTGEGTR